MVKTKNELNLGNKLLLLILTAAFFIRIIFISFPALSSEEARISYRGYVISTQGKDELGRDFPVLFNSSTDYQLPLVSYITAAGIKIFGKNDTGARLPFILIGTFVVYLIYLVSKKFLKDEKFNLLTAFIGAFSPALIYLSKVPNESIILIFLLLLIFYLLTKNKINLILLSIVLIFIVLTSKVAWFIIVPFTALTILFGNNEIGKKQKFFVIVLSLTLVIITVSVFFLIPQAKRSFIENNFSIFIEESLTTSINRLRGQGIDKGWPYFVDRLLFNKLHIFLIGLSHYVSQFSLSSFFGWFDNKNIYSFVLGGLLPKVSLIPFFFGAFLLLRNKVKQINFIGVLMLSITFPAVFVYPDVSLNLFNLLTPIFILIAAYGMFNFKKYFLNAFVILIFLEILFLYSFLDFQNINTNETRPLWVNIIIEDIDNKIGESVAVSNNITNDFSSYYVWYSNFDPKFGFQDIVFPYKVNTSINTLIFINSKIRINDCGLNFVNHLYLGERDYMNMKNRIEKTPVKIFKDNRDKDAVFYYKNLCLEQTV